MPDKVLAFYIRLSSEDRDLKTNALKNESNTVFNQRRLLQDYYDTHESLHGYKVIVFCDDGVTGTHFDRPKFDELIEMARNQEIHCIMVKDLSRFGRNFLEMGNYLELILPLYGVRFISINDAFDSHWLRNKLIPCLAFPECNLVPGKTIDKNLFCFHKLVCINCWFHLSRQKILSFTSLPGGEVLNKQDLPRSYSSPPHYPR